MTPENRNALQAAIDDLKRVVATSMGEEHESCGFIDAIENTISSIEQKSLWSGNALGETSFAPSETVLNLEPGFSSAIT